METRPLPLRHGDVSPRGGAVGGRGSPVVAADLGARAGTWGAVGELLPGCAGQEGAGTTGRVTPPRGCLVGQEGLSTQGLHLPGLPRLHTGTCSGRRPCFPFGSAGPSVGTLCTARGPASAFWPPFPHEATPGCSLKHSWAPLSLSSRYFHPGSVRSAPAGGSPGPVSPIAPKRGSSKDPSRPSSAFPRCFYLGENNHGRLCFQQMRARKRLRDGRADKGPPGRGAPQPPSPPCWGCPRDGDTGTRGQPPRASGGPCSGLFCAF